MPFILRFYDGFSSLLHRSVSRKPPKNIRWRLFRKKTPLRCRGFQTSKCLKRKMQKLVRFTHSPNYNRIHEPSLSIVRSLMRTVEMVLAFPLYKVEAITVREPLHTRTLTESQKSSIERLSIVVLSRRKWVLSMKTPKDQTSFRVVFI